jgi:glycyl-tRNA synthetase beta subunit
MKPDQATRATIAAVTQSDISAIEKMTTRLQAIAGSMNPASFNDLAAAAYLLHNIYNALENSFEQISRSFENHVTDLAQWYKKLLGKMFLEIPGIRPAVISKELRGTPNDLRGFHHSYDF